MSIQLQIISGTNRIWIYKLINMDLKKGPNASLSNKFNGHPSGKFENHK